MATPFYHAVEAGSGREFQDRARVPAQGHRWLSENQTGCAAWPQPPRGVAESLLFPFRTRRRFRLGKEGDGLDHPAGVPVVLPLGTVLVCTRHLYRRSPMKNLIAVGQYPERRHEVHGTASGLRAPGSAERHSCLLRTEYGKDRLAAFRSGSPGRRAPAGRRSGAVRGRCCDRQAACDRGRAGAGWWPGSRWA